MRVRRWRWVYGTAVIAALAGPGARAAGPMDDLVRAYPDALARFDGAALIWRDGTRVVVGGGRPDKSIEEQLRAGSVLDQMRLRYPVGAAVGPAPLEDPGRIRDKVFFDKMYGDCRKGEVLPKLARVVWLPKTWGHAVSVTSVNGVDRRLEAVSRELDELPSALKATLYPPAGTYVCRAVADAGQASMHGWGAAIDLNVRFSDYWLWRGGGRGVPPYINRIPEEVVTVFERHGFIWGGRWRHFDTMHFEYRPELIGSMPEP